MEVGVLNTKNTFKEMQRLGVKEVDISLVNQID